MSTHAFLSASKAHRWLKCPGSLAVPDEKTSSEFAEEGTRAHAMAATMLIGEAAENLGGQEMLGYVSMYVDYVRTHDGLLYVETPIPLEDITGEEEAEGTPDAVVVAVDELIVTDLKYGRGVKIEAEDNMQLLIYAAAAMEHFGMLADVRTVRMVIIQPRLDHVAEWVVPADYVHTVAATIKAQAAPLLQARKDGTLDSLPRNPGEEQCRFCPAKGNCPALADFVSQEVFGEFPLLEAPQSPRTAVTPEEIARALAALPLIEQWAAAVKEQAHANLTAGQAVPGYKLVLGRPGNRKWADDEQAEQVLKSMRVKSEDMYDRTVISPTRAEKLHGEGKIGERQWPRLQALITRAEGKPAIAPESDKRPAWSPVADFEDLGAEP